MIRELEQCQGRQHRSTQVAFKSIPEIGRVAVVEPEEHPIEVVTRCASPHLCLGLNEERVCGEVGAFSGWEHG